MTAPLPPIPFARATFALGALWLLSCGIPNGLDVHESSVEANESAATTSDIALRGSTHTALNQTTGPGTALTLATPAGTQPGDVLIAVLSTYATVNITPPSGFTRLLDTTDTGTSVGGTAGVRNVIFMRVVASASAATHAFALSTSARGLGSLFAYGNLDPAQPIDALVSAKAASVATQHSTPTISTTVDRTLLLGIFASVQPLEPARSTSSLAFELSDQSAGNTGSWGIHTSVYQSLPRDKKGAQGNRSVTFAGATDSATLTLLALRPRPPVALGLRYTGPKIWGASDSIAGRDPSAKSFDTLRAELKASGSNLNGHRSYHNQASSPRLSASDIARHNAGAMLVTHMRTNVGGASAWANIARGDYDAIYDAFFLQMLELKYGDGTVLPSHSVFTLDAEFDRFQTGMSTVHGTTGDFKAAWVHLYDRLRKTGPHAIHPNNARLLFGFAPTDWGLWHSLTGTLATPGLGSADRVSSMWPGDAYVDLFTPDSYNKLASWSPNAPAAYLPQWHSMESLFELARDWTVATGHGVGKQLFIVEGDCQEYGSLTPAWDEVVGGGRGPYPASTTFDNGAKKRAWFTEGAEYIRTHSDVIGFLYWNVDYVPNTTPSAYDGFKAGGITALR